MDYSLKVGRLKCNLSTTSTDYKTTTDFYSYDNNVTQIIANLFATHDEPLELNLVDKIRLTMLFVKNGEILRRDYLFVKGIKAGTAYLEIPDEIRGYVGEVRCGVTVDFKDGSQADAGVFKFQMKRSLVDENIEELQGSYSQEFEELVQKLQVVADESVAKINEIKTSVSLVADNIKDEIQAETGKVANVAENEKNKMQSMTTNVKAAADAEITKIKAELPRVEQELSGLTADLAVADDKLQDVEARQDVLEQELIDGQYCDLQTLAEFSSGKQLDVAMDHKVGEVFARDLEHINLAPKSIFGRKQFKITSAGDVTWSWGTMPSYLFDKYFNASQVTCSFDVTVVEITGTNGKIYLRENGGKWNSYTNELKTADMVIGETYRLKKTYDRLNYPLVSRNIGVGSLNAVGTYIVDNLCISLDGIDYYVSAPEDYGIVHGQPNLFDGSSLEGREVSVSWYNVLQNYNLLSPDCSVKPGDTVTLIAHVYNDENHSAGLRGRCRVDGTYHDTLSERFNNQKIALTMKIPENADWFQFCINTGVQLPITWIIKEEQLLKGKFTENESWKPSQKDSGLIPVNDGYITADKAETIIYGSKAAHRVKLSLTDHFKSQHNGKTPADLLARISNLKLSGTVKSADGCEIIDSAGNVLFESGLDETAFSFDLPVQDGIELYIQSKTASDGVTAVTTEVDAHLTYSVKLSIDDFMITTAAFNQLADRVSALENIGGQA